MNFEHSLVIEASAEDLFWLTQDYQRRLEWDPYLKSAKLLDGAAKADVGVKVLCVNHNGQQMETEYVSFNPPHVTAVKMTRGPWIVQSFAGSWQFEMLAPEQTRVTFCYHLKARPAFLEGLLTPLIARVFGRDTERRLKALKQFVERG